MGMPWCFRDRCLALARSGKAFVINLDDSFGKGTHWTAARVVDGTLYYADPFGTVLNGWPPAEFDSYSTRVVNSTAFQHPSTALCGYYALLFARAMNSIDKKIAGPSFEHLLARAVST